MMGHPGMTKMTRTLTSIGKEAAVDDVKKVYKHCKPCGECKGHVSKPRVLVLERAQSYNEIVATDLMDLGTGIKKLYAQTVIDLCTRWLEVRVQSTKTGQQTKEAFLSAWMATHGKPDAVMMDNGTEFYLLRELLRGLGVQLMTSAPYSPQSNGLCEKSHEEILNARTVFCDSQLPKIEWIVRLIFENYIPDVYNRSYHSSIGTSLHEKRGLGVPFFFEINVPGLKVLYKPAITSHDKLDPTWMQARVVCLWHAGEVVLLDKNGESVRIHPGRVKQASYVDQPTPKDDKSTTRMTMMVRSRTWSLNHLMMIRVMRTDLSIHP